MNKSLHQKVSDAFIGKITDYFSLSPDSLSMVEEQTFIKENKIWWYVKSNTGEIFAVLWDVDLIKEEISNLRCKILSNK